MRLLPGQGPTQATLNLLLAHHGTPWWIWATVIAPLVLAVVLVAFVWPEARGNVGPSDHLGPANWDFSASFGSSLTVFSSLLGTILSASLLPTSTLVPADTYAGLNLMFGVMIIAGPLIYTATQQPTPVHRAGSVVQEPQYQGRVWGFLVATALTLWAVLGELVTVALVLNEIRRGGSLPAALFAIMIALLAIGAVSLLVVARQRIEATLEAQREAGSPERKQALRSHYLALALPEAEVPALADIEPSRASWPLL